MRFNELKINEGIVDGVKAGLAGLGGVAQAGVNAGVNAVKAGASKVAATYKAGQVDQAKKDLPNVIASMRKLKDSTLAELNKLGFTLDNLKQPQYKDIANAYFNLVKNADNYTQIGNKLGVARRSAYMNFEGADEIKAKLSKLQTELQKLQTTNGDPKRIAQLKSLISKEQKDLAALNEGIFDTMRSVGAGLGAAGSAAKGAVTGAVQGAAQAVANKVNAAQTAVSGAAQNVADKFNAAKSTKQAQLLVANKAREMQKLVATANHLIDLIQPQQTI